MSSRHHKPSHKEHEPLDGKDNREAQGQKNYKKIYRPDLPIIDLNSGPNISHIREAITQYCQRELGPISNIFLEGRYRAPATATYDLVEIAADSSGLKKDQASTRIKRADADNDKYEKSKMKLHGVLSGMTTREVDDKVAAHRDSLKSAQSEAQTRVGQIAQMPSAIQLEETAHREAEELSCPLALWKCIVHVTTTRTIGNTRIDQNNLSINFANIRQRPNESVSDFKRRISNLLDSFEATKMERPQDSAIAMRFLHGLEDSRYGTLKTWLGNELANGRDAYPLDLDSAAGQATKWLVNSARNTLANTAPQSATTFLTNATSPRRRDKKAPHNETRYDAPANSEHCTFCNNSGHSIEKCFKMAAASKLATQETADKKEKYSKGKFSPPTGAMLATVDEDLDMDIPLHKTAYHSISFIIGHAKSLSSYDLILDTGANGSIVHNKALLHSVEDSPPMSFSGIAGTLQTTTAGTIRDLGTARYHPKSPANILSFSEMRAAGHTITFRRTNNIDTFTVATKTQKYLFKQRVTGLYVCDLTPINHTFIATVQDNEALHSKREVTQATAARELQERLAHPPDARLAQALSYGNIIYSKVSPADIIRAHSIYGPNTSGLKGRTVHRTAEAFPSPQESLRDTTPQQLYADIFIANGLSFFITVAKPLEHLIATPIDSRDTGSLRRAVKHHLSFYSQRRISTPIIYSDNERGLAAVGPDLAAIHVQIVHSGPGMHVHIVERAIRYIKEGVRSTQAGLPYNCPRAIFRLMIPFVASRLNMFPSSTRTDHLSAFQIVHNRPADARRDCHLAFGAMYHVTNRERAHTMTPRTVAAIGVAQVPNGTGTCAFFAIHNHQIIKANHFSAVPLTPDMIAHMNRLAADDKVATAIDTPYYIHGKALSHTDTPTHSPSREPTTAIAPALTDELPATTVHNEEEQPEAPTVPNEVALETAAPLSDYSVPSQRRRHQQAAIQATQHPAWRTPTYQH